MILKIIDKYLSVKQLKLIEKSNLKILKKVSNLICKNKKAGYFKSLC